MRRRRINGFAGTGHPIYASFARDARIRVARQLRPYGRRNEISLTLFLAFSRGMKGGWITLAEILKSPRFRKVYYGALRVARLGISACSPAGPGTARLGRWSLHPAESQRSRPWFTDLLIFDESLSPARPNKEDRGSLAINFPPRCPGVKRLQYLNRVSP